MAPVVQANRKAELNSRQLKIRRYFSLGERLRSSRAIKGLCFIEAHQTSSPIKKAGNFPFTQLFAASSASSQETRYNIFSLQYAQRPAHECTLETPLPRYRRYQAGGDQRTATGNGRRFG
ncbi:hypothetical protein TNCV_3064181 [Trichonephila clavipes]|nr:hypothetical protein TNCV_3064181 [Trichonephila clavipes]